jgi:hypothetical protein
MQTGRVRLRQNARASATGERKNEVYTFGQMAPMTRTNPQALCPSHDRLVHDGLGLPNDAANPGESGSSLEPRHAQLLPMPVLQMDTDLDELLTKAHSPLSRPAMNADDDSKDESPPQFCITAPSEVKEGVECTRGVELMLVEPSNDGDQWSLDSEANLSTSGFPSGTSGNFLISPTQHFHTADPEVKVILILG